MKTFKFAPGLELRVIDREGTPWFAAADVCEALGLQRDTNNGALQNHMRTLEADERDTMLVASGNPTRKQYVVNESGLYSLVLRSRKPEAKAFKRWVTSEVLPAIRKNGGYMTPAVAQEAIDSPTVFMA